MSEVDDAWEANFPKAEGDSLGILNIPSPREAFAKGFIAGRKADNEETFSGLWPWVKNPAECTQVHRGPAGPNEDIGMCGKCGMPTFSMRPKGESFGWHADDCSLPVNHPSYCVGGGSGHVKPEGEKIRG